MQKGEAEGEALVSKAPISFLGGVDPETGEIIEADHQLKGESIEDRVLVFPHGKGSTVGSYVLYQMASNETAPLAIINRATEAIVATGAILANIPLVHKLNQDPIKAIENGDLVKVQGENVEVKKK